MGAILSLIVALIVIACILYIAHWLLFHPKSPLPDPISWAIFALIGLLCIVALFGYLGGPTIHWPARLD